MMVDSCILPWAGWFGVLQVRLGGFPKKGEDACRRLRGYRMGVQGQTGTDSKQASQSSSTLRVG